MHIKKHITSGISTLFLLLVATEVKAASILPDCAQIENKGGCREINTLLETAINIAKILLGLLGVIAFVMFIYGGLVTILSFGSPEKYKKGTQVLVNAVIGIIIAVSAYLIIDIVLTTLGVDPAFRGVTIPPAA